MAQRIQRQLRARPVNRRLRHQWWMNRTLCDVLEEMRTCVKMVNFGPLPGLIEEAQMMANRMEGALGHVKDIPKMEKQRDDLRREIRGLIKQLPPEKDED